MDLSGKRVLVTGGTGFFGRHIVAALRCRAVASVHALGTRDCDLRERDEVRRLLASHRPHLVVHAAGIVGGIGANRARPAEFFYDNAMMGLNVIEQSYRAGVSKAVILGTICAYPKFTPLPMREDDLWNGYPEETNAPYGLAKKMLLVQTQAYREQYGFNGIHLMPVNLYGPGDNFDPKSSHVIPALIRKCVEAVDRRASAIDVWGSGRASREFLYVEDAAEAVARAAERYDGPDPVNLGGMGEITVAELVALIAEKTNFAGEIRWDPRMPDGQPRRAMDSSRAQAAFGWSPSTPFALGLEKTVRWYLASRVHAGG